MKYSFKKPFVKKGLNYLQLKKSLPSSYRKKHETDMKKNIMIDFKKSKKKVILPNQSTAQDSTSYKPHSQKDEPVAPRKKKKLSLSMKDRDVLFEKAISRRITNKIKKCFAETGKPP